MNVRPQPQAGRLKVPAHLQPYVDVLGIDGAVDFLLTFGGGYAYLSIDPAPDTPIAEVIGTEKTGLLAKRCGAGSLRVPTGKPFIAAVLRGKGMRPTQIARKLHVSDVTVRKWLGPEDEQLTLFPS